MIDNYWKNNLLVCTLGAFTTVFAMTLMLPFLPVYVEELGVVGHTKVVQWSGIAFSATFFAAGLVAPLWGYLGDKYGRKSMLVRASLGMAIVMSLMGLATNIWQLVFLRLLAGLAGGYSSGATILIAIQTPKARSAWALGVLASGVMAGNLMGPLIGGIMPPLIGIRPTFWGAGILIFLSFLLTAFYVKENHTVALPAGKKKVMHESSLVNHRVVFTMLITAFLLMFANMSIEPIITVYVDKLENNGLSTTFIAGLVMSAAALGSILSAAQLGKLADRIGHEKVISCALLVSGLLLIPQAFVTQGWQLIVLRFLMGLALGGLIPCITAVIKKNVNDDNAGKILGFSVSAQFCGQVVGPLMGGFIGGYQGLSPVFLYTSLVMMLGAYLSAKLINRYGK